MIPIRLKSKTNLFALGVVVLGGLQGNLPHVSALLGEHQGIVYVLLGVVVAVLRELTTTPVTERPNE